MPIHTHTCVSVSCDVCGTPLQAFEDDGELHFPGLAEARKTARHYRWPVASDQFVCPEDDADHQAAMDELLPPAPVSQVPGQAAFDGEVSD